MLLARAGVGNVVLYASVSIHRPEKPGAHLLDRRLVA